MFSRVSRRMAADNGTEVQLEEGSQSSSKRQVETSKGGLSETGITLSVTEILKNSIFEIPIFLLT